VTADGDPAGLSKPKQPPDSVWIHRPVPASSTVTDPLMPAG